MAPEQVKLYSELDAFAQNRYNQQHADDPLGAVGTIEAQVVAGMVYRLHYVTMSGKNVTVSIYRDFNGEISLKNIDIQN
jgi:hypothetical protein